MVMSDARRAQNIERHTAGRHPGWYVTTGFFWHEVCSVWVGPFTTQHDAMTCRGVIERILRRTDLFVDEVQRVELPDWSPADAEQYLRDAAGPKRGHGTDLDTLPQCYRRAREIKTGVGRDWDLVEHAASVLQAAGAL